MAKKKKKNTQKKAVQAQASNNELKKALQALKAERTPQNEAVMIEKLKNAKLLAPVIFSTEVKPDAEGRVLLPNNASIKYVLVNTEQNAMFFPVFSDMEEARKMPVGQDQNTITYITRTLKDYGQMFSDATNTAEGIVLDPRSSAIFLPKSSIQKLLETEPEQASASSPVKNGRLPKGISVTFAEPSTYPTAMVNAVYEECRNMPEISRVWMKLMTLGVQRYYTMFVETDKEDNSILERIHKAAEAYVKDIPAEVLYYNNELQERAIGDAFPLYDRELEV